ncbi:phage anti-repressor protein [Weissella oryzae SG25]|uniref:Phage anti-repressor protein n=1 Tax=Weissella oryzae (strain DSM 25784 / JCM 18191 / LMG 30913 / SG25) TaxID=1329250 RepID=A0A069CSM4_WEIOS|nr:phage antirepressor KilAC domain-containing protein [Weissella oryzae]GAK30397.1 phage anti-repressor protein [Weissella oryzae SG25]
MDEVKIFNFEQNEVRTTLIDDEIYFVGKDVAEAIGYVNTKDALKTHVKAKYKRGSQITTPSGNQEMVVISQSGVFQLLGESHLPLANKFQDWLYEEVLPSINKHGVYLTDAKVEEVLADPDTIIKLATQVKQERAEKLMLAQQVAESRPKADYYDKIMKSKSLVTISQIAEDYGWSAQKMNAKLYQLRVQHKVGGQWLLYSKHKNHGYTFSETQDISQRVGQDKVVMNTKWTQKGRVFIYNLLKNEGILPSIEREVSTSQESI